MESGQLEQALPLLQKAFDLNPRDERIINNLAQVLGYSGEYEQCLALFREIMDEAEATSNLAYIHTQAGNGAEAMELYSRALDVDPELRSATNALVQLAEMRSEFEQPSSIQWAARQATSPDATQPDPARPIELTVGRE
jgi:tetratricopeptide (TPR) repeat protein